MEQGDYDRAVRVGEPLAVVRHLRCRSMDTQTDERARLEQLRAELRRRGWNATLVQGERPLLRVQNPVVVTESTSRWWSAWATPTRASRGTLHVLPGMQAEAAEKVAALFA